MHERDQFAEQAWNVVLNPHTPVHEQELLYRKKAAALGLSFSPVLSYISVLRIKNYYNIMINELPRRKRRGILLIKTISNAFCDENW